MVKFLIVRFSSIGDIVLTTPVIRHLKTQVEESEIHYLTKKAFAPIVESNPHVDRVHILDGNLDTNLQILRKEGIDYIIDLHHNARSARVKLRLRRMDFTVRKLNLQKWLLVNFKRDRLPDLHMVDRNLETIKAFIEEQDQLGLDYFIPESEEVDLASLPEAFRNGYIGLSIGAQHETKKLPVDSIIELCRSITYPVLILGGPSDRANGEKIAGALNDRAILNTCGSYSIHQSASLVKQSRILITHDTGLMHIGAAFGRIILSIWGNTIPRFGMYPYRADPASLQFEIENLRCRPCSKIGYQKCPKKHFRCMVDQDIQAIASNANKLFDSTGQ